jgi:hypothetical protein
MERRPQENAILGLLSRIVKAEKQKKALRRGLRRAFSFCNSRPVSACGG